MLSVGCGSVHPVTIALVAVIGGASFGWLFGDVWSLLGVGGLGWFVLVYAVVAELPSVAGSVGVGVTDAVTLDGCMMLLLLRER